MPRYKSKGIRSNWSEDDMKRAIAAVKRGVKIYTAAKNYNIPRRTLRRYLLEKKTTKSTLGRKPLLNEAQERDLASRIIRLCHVGYPLTQRVLRTCVKTFCIQNNVSVSSRGLMVGRDWLRGFLNRHKNISRRKSQNLNPARAAKLNKVVVADYFAKLKKTMEENDVLNKPERIFNVDEKGCQLNLHKAPQVLAERGTKRVHLVAPEHGENVTVVSCGSALGHAIPPMILFKGKRMKPEWIDSLPTGSIAQMTPKGSMNTETFVNWLHHFAKFKLSGPCVLIFDGAKCHLDYTIVEVAEKFNIKLFCLPSNTTHELQPMDKSVFHSYEYYWDEEVLRYWSINQDRKITKQRFGIIFSKVWDKAATPANIRAGFEATGIFPFDPQKIPEEAYAPSIPTYDPTITESNTGQNENEDPNDITDSSVDSESILACSHPNLNISGDRYTPVQSGPSGTNAKSPVHALSQDNNNIATAPSSPSRNDQLKLGENIRTEGDDSDDDVPLASLKQNSQNIEAVKAVSDLLNESYESFSAMLKTPVKTTSSPKTAPRAKAINSLAQELTKATFVQKKLPGPSGAASQKRNTLPGSSNKTSKKKKSTSKSSSAASQKKNDIPGPSNITLPKRKQDPSKRNRASSNKIPSKPKSGKGKARKLGESWYCFVCDQDRVADMRSCFKCGSYVYEECVGLSAEDTENFICPQCYDD
ncbi:uncharacterized protein LOC106143167 [Amyelois transitella]|uniref:uncharacterized protein LOC106143167 n=1 Tax=Amyelois transitella TaxID=680683 RepID=UPI00298FC89F|nr:uncharacterized protein LOC106143167 [Amyelois transitella]